MDKLSEEDIRNTLLIGYPTIVTLSNTAKGYYVLGVGKPLTFADKSTVIELPNDLITYSFQYLNAEDKECLISLDKELEFINETIHVLQER